MFQSKVLTRCWLCSRDTGLHQHHVIPKCYGGEEGPTVTLCGSCHTFIHQSAISSRPVRPFNTAMDYLIGVIREAKKKVVDDPNKRIIVQIQLHGKDNQKLKRLSKMYELNQVDTMLLALRKLYAANTPPSTNEQP